MASDVPGGYTTTPGPDAQMASRSIDPADHHLKQSSIECWMLIAPVRTANANSLAPPSGAGAPNTLTGRQRAWMPAVELPWMALLRSREGIWRGSAEASGTAQLPV